jgi:hypothetical protein
MRPINGSKVRYGVCDVGRREISRGNGELRRRSVAAGLDDYIGGAARVARRGPGVVP